MKTHHLQTELWLPQPLDRVFKFFADPRNLERLSGVVTTIRKLSGLDRVPTANQAKAR